MAASKPITPGEKFGRLTIVSEAERRYGYKCALCHCDCGTIMSAAMHMLRNGNTRSCGCLQVESITKRNRTHGLTGTPAWYSYHSAKQRCSNRRSQGWKDYGGRGITMCAHWLESFENFYADMGQRPPKTSLHRIDNDGPYSPENCRWATPSEQGLNSRNIRLMTCNGETFSLGEWCRRLNVSRHTMYRRFSAGWTVAAALSTPNRHRPTV